MFSRLTARRRIMLRGGSLGQDTDSFWAKSTRKSSKRLKVALSCRTRLNLSEMLTILELKPSNHGKRLKVALSCRARLNLSVSCPKDPLGGMIRLRAAISAFMLWKDKSGISNEETRFMKSSVRDKTNCDF